MAEVKNLPNLLIIGAAKSGTTSLHNYLKQHPELYMTDHKEPHFLINNEIGLRRIHKAVNNIEDYQQMFEGSSEYKYRGESSVMYLPFPQIAIPNIKKYLDDNVKIIIMLRNPVERAYAGYLHNIRYNTSESLPFEDAIKKSEDRYHANKDMTPDTRYLHVGLYYNQVKQYFDTFGKNVHVIIYDDYVFDINKSIKELFYFLGVRNIQIDSSKRHMVGGWVFKNFLLRKLMIPKNSFKSFIKYLLPNTKFRKQIRQGVMRLGSSKPPEISINMSTFLKSYYKEDVRKLSSLLGVNLNHWIE
tara:strand:- start:11356 stop:12258 length:903 start_codon:yes stop_codon:yes gene_type:complete